MGYRSLLVSFLATTFSIGLLSVPAQAIDVKKHTKCADVAIRALFKDSYDLPVRVENGKLRSVNLASFSDHASHIEIKTKEGLTATFEKNGGQIQKVVTATSIMSLDEDCNLTREVASDVNVIYDRPLCALAVKSANELGLGEAGLTQCQLLEAKVRSHIEARNTSLAKEAKSPKISSRLGGAMHIIGACADQFAFEQARDGRFKRLARFSPEWLKNLELPQSAAEAMKYGSPISR